MDDVLQGAKRGIEVEEARWNGEEAVRLYSHQQTGFTAGTIADNDELAANLGHGDWRDRCCF